MLRRLHSVERLVIVSEVVREVAADFVSAKFLSPPARLDNQIENATTKCPGHGVEFESNLPKKANALPKG